MYVDSLLGNYWLSKTVINNNTKNRIKWQQQDMFGNHSDVSSSTGSDPEPGEEVRGSHDTQRQDRRRADGGKL